MTTRNSSSTKQGGGVAPWLGIFLGIFLVPFLVGGIYSAIVFYRSVRDVVAYYDPQTAIAPSPTLPGGVPKNPGETKVATTPQTSPTAKPVPTPTKEERLNILLMGLDQRPQEQGPFRSDTMILVSIDRKNKTASMLSIPRDLWVPIPGYGENRINTAYFFGGPGLAKQTVQYNLGVPVHYYAVVSFQGLEKIVDTLGGITIDVETAIHDDKYPADNNYGYQTVSIAAGRQRMDGDTALKYARVRHGGSDFGRMQRQQKVLLAIRARAIELGPSLLPRLPTLWKEFEKLIDTDFPLKEATALAPVAMQIDVNAVRRGSIDSTMTTPLVTSTGADVLWPDREKIGKLVEELLPHPGS